MAAVNSKEYNVGIFEHFFFLIQHHGSKSDFSA
jgi:hypothetical protein